MSLYTLKNLQPTLLTNSVRQTADFYETVFGFTIQGYGYAGRVPISCVLSRDAAVLHFVQAKPGANTRPSSTLCAKDEASEIPPVDLAIGVTAVSAARDDYGGRGARILPQPLESRDQFFVAEDNNGYRIMFFLDP